VKRAYYKDDVSHHGDTEIGGENLSLTKERFLEKRCFFTAETAEERRGDLNFRGKSKFL
jgi:hypothetical protein